MSTDRIFGTAHHEDEGHWISVSDLMAGLMIIFLFIAITYIRPIVNIAINWQDTREEIYTALLQEFKNDLHKWNAELDKETLVVRFKAPEVLFAPARATLTVGFKEILNDFFPRYLAVLFRFMDRIEEVRIEGHTSSEWVRTTPDEAYFMNMALSQARTRSVLYYGLLLDKSAPFRLWAKQYITANGLSSSKLILVGDVEDQKRSRRVEFRVRTNSEERIRQIMEKVR